MTRPMLHRFLLQSLHRSFQNIGGFYDALVPFPLVCGACADGTRQLDGRLDCCQMYINEVLPVRSWSSNLRFPCVDSLSNKYQAHTYRFLSQTLAPINRFSLQWRASGTSTPQRRTFASKKDTSSPLASTTLATSGTTTPRLTSTTASAT
jgi:hypothetical protein